MKITMRIFYIQNTRMTKKWFQYFYRK